MEEEMLQTVVTACKTACGAEHKYYKDYAMQIKAELDKELGPSWHIVVGKLHFPEHSVSNVADRNCSFRHALRVVCRL